MAEKKKMQFTILMKNTEKNFIFKKIENEILSWMVGWFKNFSCIDISTHRSLCDSTDNTSPNLKTNSRNSDLETSETIRKSTDHAHSESSSEDKLNSILLKPVPKPLDPKEYTLQLINEEVENFLALLESTADTLYK